ncbi:MAG: PAS domain S-box protein [Sterolibacterium sp.]
MKVFERIENTNRLIIGLVVVFSLANVTTALLAEKSVDASIQASGRRLQALEAANLLAKGSDNLTNAARAYAATGDQHYRNAYQTETEVTRLRERAIERLIALGANKNEMELVEQAKQGADKLAELESKAIQAASAGETQKSLNLVYGIEYRVAKENVISPIAEAYMEIEARHTREVEELSSHAQLMARLADGAMFLNILTVLTGLVYYFRRRVVAPVVSLARQTQALLGGDHRVRFEYLQDGSEVGDLARSLEAYRTTSEQSESLRLINSHVATITADIQRANDFKDLAQILFAHLAPLFDLGQASFYRANSERSCLILCGEYARVGGGKNPDDEIPFGTGLLGQCASEQQTIVVNDPPEGYLQIASVLGAAPARMLALLPIKTTVALLGVIELASFKPLCEADRALLDRLLPVLAMCMEIIERNQHAQHLLKESLTQSVALENQQRESVERLRRILEDSPAGVAINAEDGRPIFANHRLSELLAVSAEELARRNASEFYKHPADRNDFLAQLKRDGHVNDYQTEFVRSDGATLTVLLSSRLVDFGDDRHLVTWIYDITERKLAGESAQKRGIEGET